MSCYLYILKSEIRNRYYIGHSCASMEDRLRKHNTNHQGFTGHTADWKVVYIEEYATRELAYAREREIKQWKSRKKIEVLIRSSEHPD